MMPTGTTRYLVRRGFSECEVWREALGNAAQLLWVASKGECIDAPDRIPTGGASGTREVAESYSREYPNGF